MYFQALKFKITAVCTIVDDDEVSGKIRKKFPRMAMQIQDLKTFFTCRGRQFL